jgi:hypothetical protein
VWTNLGHRIYFGWLRLHQRGRERDHRRETGLRRRRSHGWRRGCSPAHTKPALEATKRLGKSARRKRGIRQAHHGKNRRQKWIRDGGQLGKADGELLHSSATITDQPRATKREEKGSATSWTRCEALQRLTEAVKHRNDKARARRRELGSTAALAARLQATDCNRVAGGRHLGSLFIETRARGISQQHQEARVRRQRDTEEVLPISVRSWGQCYHAGPVQQWEQGWVPAVSWREERGTPVRCSGCRLLS